MRSRRRRRRRRPLASGAAALGSVVIELVTCRTSLAGNKAVRRKVQCSKPSGA